MLALSPTVGAVRPAGLSEFGLTSILTSAGLLYARCPVDVNFFGPFDEMCAESELLEMDSVGGDIRECTNAFLGYRYVEPFYAYLHQLRMQLQGTCHPAFPLPASSYKLESTSDECIFCLCYASPQAFRCPGGADCRADVDALLSAPFVDL